MNDDSYLNYSYLRAQANCKRQHSIGQCRKWKDKADLPHPTVLDQKEEIISPIIKTKISIKSKLRKSYCLLRVIVSVAQRLIKLTHNNLSEGIIYQRNSSFMIHESFPDSTI